MDVNLREQYKWETGKSAYCPYPEVDYVEWLEQRIAALASAPAGEACKCAEKGITGRTTSSLSGVESVTIGLDVSKDCPVHKQYFVDNAPFGKRLAAKDAPMDGEGR
jgi:hypothetical protein